jgi:hypothetical protein
MRRSAYSSSPGGTRRRSCESTAPRSAAPPPCAIQVPAQALGVPRRFRAERASVGVLEVAQARAQVDRERRQLARRQRPDQALAAQEGTGPGDPAAPAELRNDDGDEGDDRAEPGDHQEQVATRVLAALLDEAEIVQQHQLGDRPVVADDLVRAHLYRAARDLHHRRLTFRYLARRLALERRRIVVRAQEQLVVACAQADRDQALIAYGAVEKRLQARAFGVGHGARDRVRKRVRQQLAAQHQVA